jgi:glycosyltransferase involved in cell wall biosynthesis
MKIAIARSPYRYGGIFRRFGELCSYCINKHEVIGLMPFARDNAIVMRPARTYGYACHYINPSEIVNTQSANDVIEAFNPIISRIGNDLRSERPLRVLAVDTDLKGLVIIAACRRLGIPVTTFVASVTSEVEAYARRPRTRLASIVEQYCLEQSDKLIFPSRFAAIHCSEKYSCMAPFRVIYNGIASAFLTARGVLPRSRTFGAVMRLSGVKNPTMLVRIAKELREYGCIVELITDAKQSSSLRKRLDDIRILAPRSLPESLARFYGSCTGIVCPSNFEASGNVPMECIATGTPAVITDRMGIAEVFCTLGLAHLIVKVNDVRTTVDRLLNAQPIADNIREVLRKQFAWPKVCNEILSAL